MSGECNHQELAQSVGPKTEGCEECLKEGASWVQLRMCLICGHVGCCDSSWGRHATKHFEETGHPLMRSIEPGHNWTWCYIDKVYL
jgi:uncharacterized UBP type Zn finger protein